MDFPEPPRWLGVIASVVLAPLWALFVFLWLLHELVHGLVREWTRKWE